MNVSKFNHGYSGNITTSISDHLPQLIIIENGKGDNPDNS